jgi:Cu(I)/Ag(I) efflux system membrane fusion protein
VEFTAESYPGEVFTGRLSFIDPVLTEATRTIKVRVDVDNPDLRLKPGMFVRAVVRAPVATAGRVMSPDLADKWICPMHPDVIKDSPGSCDICGMPIVPAESLGYVSATPEEADKPLVIPTTAALVTGTRAIVYVEVPNQERPTFEGREIVLGPRAGDFYLVRSGLKEGERVVTKGNFTIDAELQIQAKPSMMTPEGGGGGGMHMNTDMGGEKSKSAEPNAMSSMTETIPGAVRMALQKVQAAGDVVDEALASQELSFIREAFGDLEKAVAAVPKELLTEHPALQWQEYAMFLTNDGVEGKGVDTLADARRVAGTMHKHLQSMTVGLGLAKGTKPMVMPITVPPAFHVAFDKVVRDYLRIAQALATDKTDEAKGAVQQAVADLHAVDMELLKGDAHMNWMTAAAELGGLLNDIGQANDIEQMRQGFAPLSEQIAATVRQFGWTGRGSLYQFHCPMAFNNQGANWLQNTEQTHNPYFGATMPTCGSIVDVIATGSQKETHDHEQ